MNFNKFKEQLDELSDFSDSPLIFRCCRNFGWALPIASVEELHRLSSMLLDAADRINNSSHKLALQAVVELISTFIASKSKLEDDNIRKQYIKNGLPKDILSYLDTHGLIDFEQLKNRFGSSGNFNVTFNRLQSMNLVELWDNGSVLITVLGIESKTI